MFAGDGVDDSEVPLHTYHYQDEYGRCVAQVVDEMIQLADEVAQYPTGKRKSKEHWLVFTRRRFHPQ